MGSDIAEGSLWARHRTLIGGWTIVRKDRVHSRAIRLKEVHPGVVTDVCKCIKPGIRGTVESANAIGAPPVPLAVVDDPIIDADTSDDVIAKGDERPICIPSLTVDPLAES